MNPKYSVIIPVYNVAPYLSECLDSLCSQSVVSWEAVCVDDGSTDDSAKILSAYAAKDSRIKVLRQRNAGVSAARNTAVSAARGEWLYFLDADDVVVPNGFSKLDELTKDDDFDAFFLGGPLYFSREHPRGPIGIGKTIFASRMPENGKRLLLTGRLWGWPCIRLLRRTVFASVRFPIGVANLEDSISLTDVLAVKARWRWVDYKIYGYRFRADSACRKMTVDKVVDIISGFTRIYQDVREKLSCTHKEATVVLRQYSRHLWVYISAAIVDASYTDLKKIADAYWRHERAVNYRMANLFLRRLLAIMDAPERTWRFAFYFRASYWYERIKDGLRRRLNKG